MLPSTSDSYELQSLLRETSLECDFKAKEKQALTWRGTDTEGKLLPLMDYPVILAFDLEDNIKSQQV